MCVLFQTLATVLGFLRRSKSRAWFFDNLLSFFVLVQVLACSLLHGQAMEGYYLALLAPTGYVTLRNVVFVTVVFLAAIVIVLSRKLWPLLVIAASAATLPIIEPLTGRVFAYLYVAAMLFWLTQSVRVCVLRYIDLRTNLSALSIKNAVDSLHTGIAFGDPDGFILLCNVQMQRLMATMTGKVHRNIGRFYELLLSGKIEPGCTISEFEEQIVCLHTEGSAWMFTKKELRIEKKKYIQLTAADITEQWKLTSQLRRLNDML
jgi:hypothetical protein